MLLELGSASAIRCQAPLLPEVLGAYLRKITKIKIKRIITKGLASIKIQVVIRYVR